MADDDQAPDDTPPAPEQEPEPAPPTDDGGGGEARQRRFPRLPSAPSSVSTGAGFLLGLLFWTWVGLPMLKGGPAEVKKVFMAKFFNKSPDGKWLP